MDIYEKYGVKRVINASGKMTILGGSRITPQVSEACRIGASNFFEVHDLLEKSGEYLARLLHVEDAYIVASASSGIAQCVAAAITAHDAGKILHLQDTRIMKREIILPKGHNVDYGTSIEVPITLGGGRVVEAGYANACSIAHVESQINENTAALLYVKSHHCVQKGICTILEMVALAKSYQLPLIVDAAAEEDLCKYVEMGADAVIYSGTKALEGPTSGLIVGKKSFLSDVKAQKAGIGRVMKIGKENICGLVEAIEQYLQTPKGTLDDQVARLKPFHERCLSITGIQCACVQDGAGRAIMRSELTFTREASLTALQASQALKEGDLRIYTRDYRANTGVIEIDIRDVSDQELLMIYEKLANIMGGTK